MKSDKNVIDLTIPTFTLNGMNKTADDNFSTKVIEHNNKELKIELSGGKMIVEVSNTKKYYKPGTSLTFDKNGRLIAAGDQDDDVFVEQTKTVTPSTTTSRRSGTVEYRKQQLL